MLIENIVESDVQVAQVKKSPVVNVLVLVASAVAGYGLILLSDNENVSFAVMFIALIVAVVAMKGIFSPTQFYQYIPTKERIEKKEYYFDLQDMASVKSCLGQGDGKKMVEKLEKMPKDKGTSLRVILYATKSGSYMKYQMQKYIPYEYVPVN